jgi:hypothetical protein
MQMTDTGGYTGRAEVLKFLRDNREKLAVQKKSAMKRADAVHFRSAAFPEKGCDASKAIENAQELLLKDLITVRSIINTTNLLDSHGDVHMPGLWEKSLREQKNPYLLQEHKMAFSHIISDSVTASAKKMAWKELGFAYEGKTEALVFDAEIEKTRNPYMFGQYARGYVKNHSVGMRYVQLFLCVDSDEKYYREEKEAWEEYIGQVANRDEAEEKGFFWAVTEAKFIEGSAVPIGSNRATPVQSVKESFGEPSADARDDIELPAGAQKSMFSKFNLLRDLK